MIKIFKRMVSCAICILIMCCLAIPIFAESNFIVSGNTVTAKNGEAVVVISLKNNPGFASMNLFFTYDDKYLTLNRSGVINLVSDLDMSYATGGMWETRDDNPSSSSNYSKDGVLCELHFKVADNTPVGEYEVGVFVEASGYNDIDHTAYSIDAKSVSAIIKVTCPHTNKTLTPAEDSNCIKQGNNAYYTCTDCGAILKEDGKTETTIEAEKRPIGEHTFVKHDKVEPDHKNAGMAEYYTCSVCSKIFNSAKKEASSTEGFEIPPIPHTFGDEWKFDENNHWHECECGEKTPAEAHTTKEVIDTPPDEDNYGIGHDECEDCGYVTNEGKLIPPLKHEHTIEKIEAKAATCAEEGNIEHYTCTKCHKNFSDEAGENEIKDVSTPKDPDNHTGETKVVGDFAPTCKDYGYTGDTVCAGCEAVLEKGKEIEPTGEHKNTEVRDATEPNCKDEGYTGDTYCKDCGKKLKDGEVIPPNDTFHSTMEHHEKVAATCINTGTVEYWHCTKCNRNYSDEKGTLEIKDTVLPIDPTNHVNTEIRNARPATCISTGNSGDTYCTDCGILVTAGTVTSVDPNAHNYVNNVCTYCGNVRVVYRPTTYMYIDDYSHLASGIKERHVPDSMTMHTDGEYEWHYCMYCQHEYGKVPVVNIDVDDTIDIAVDDPVQSGDDELIPDVPVTEPEPSEPVQDNNPPTGIAVALLPLALAVGAVAIIRKK